MKLISVEKLKDLLTHEYTGRLLDKNKLPYKDRKGYRTCMDDVTTVLVNMPEHKAEWVLGTWTYKGEDYYALKCSKCDHQILAAYKFEDSIPKEVHDYLLKESKEHKYCRNCGARMTNIKEIVDDEISN